MCWVSQWRKRYHPCNSTNLGTSGEYTQVLSAEKEKTRVPQKYISNITDSLQKPSPSALNGWNGYIWRKVGRFKTLFGTKDPSKV